MTLNLLKSSALIKPSFIIVKKKKYPQQGPMKFGIFLIFQSIQFHPWGKQKILCQIKNLINLQTQKWNSKQYIVLALEKQVMPYNSRIKEKHAYRIEGMVYPMHALECRSTAEEDIHNFPICNKIAELCIYDIIIRIVIK